MCSVVFACRKWEHLLRFKPFIVNNDHRALTWLQGLKKQTGIVYRWLQELATYSFTFFRKPGKDMAHADALSCSPHMDEPTPEEVRESEEFIMKV